MTALLWAGFVLMIVGFLAVDLGVFHREPRVIHTREALLWSAIWVAVALLFTVGVYFLYEHHVLGIGYLGDLELSGRDAALQFLTGYVIEKSLSLDNIFVIALIFSHFRVPRIYQHRVLFWGILGAIVMRGVMIVLGAALIARFDWIVYVFGLFLLLTAGRMMVGAHEKVDHERLFLVRAARRLFPFTEKYHGERFFVKKDGRTSATMLFLVLVVVEGADLMFAVDSIPAIFAVTRDPFLVFTSNVFAILGLRALYFALAGLIVRFRFLRASLVLLLAYVGVKMLLSHHVEIPTYVSLAVIFAILGAGTAASILFPGPPAAEEPSGGD